MYLTMKCKVLPVNFNLISFFFFEIFLCATGIIVIRQDRPILPFTKQMKRKMWKLSKVSVISIEAL